MKNTENEDTECIMKKRNISKPKSKLLKCKNYKKPTGKTVKKLNIMSEEKITFKSLEKLLDIINRERYFKIQVFSLESVEIFTYALSENRIKYNIQFTSSYKDCPGLTILLKDSEIPEIPNDLSIILYSNFRDKRFIPYKFDIDIDEKKKIINNDNIFEINKRNSLSFIFGKQIDIHKHTSDSLNYIQSVIVFCMVRKNKLNDLFDEVTSTDENLNNKFVLKCELNSLVKYGICNKKGDNYKLNLSKLTIQNICNKIKFDRVFQ